MPDIKNIADKADIIIISPLQGHFLYLYSYPQGRAPVLCYIAPMGHLLYHAKTPRGMGARNHQCHFGHGMTPSGSNNVA